MSNWIDAKIQCPSENVTVIATDAKNLKNYIPATDELFGAIYYKGKWYDDPFSDYPHEYNVTYWIPLPNIA